ITGPSSATQRKARRDPHDRAGAIGFKGDPARFPWVSSDSQMSRNTGRTGNVSSPSVTADPTDSLPPAFPPLPPLIPSPLCPLASALPSPARLSVAGLRRLGHRQQEGRVQRLEPDPVHLLDPPRHGDVPDVDLPGQPLERLVGGGQAVDRGHVDRQPPAR